MISARSPEGGGGGGETTPTICEFFRGGPAAKDIPKDRECDLARRLVQEHCSDQ